MSNWLAGKSVLITGGGNGIGRAVALRFAYEGATVVVLDRDESALAALEAEGAQAEIGNIAGLTGDVTRAEDNEAAVELVHQRAGQLDVAVLNVGVFDCFADIRRMSPSEVADAYRDIFEVNVLGVLLGARAVSQAMRSGGSLIVTVSSAGLHPNGGGAIYTASKHALVGVIRQLAAEWAPSIRVNGVAPGGTTTGLASPPSLASFCAGHPSGGEREARIASQVPLGFAQVPEDHAGAYVLLASDQSRAITGVVIESDGGVGVRRPAALPAVHVSMV